VPRQGSSEDRPADVPVVTIWEEQQNSPVSFPITAAKGVQRSQRRHHTRRVGRFRWYLQNVSKDLHGIFLVGATSRAEGRHPADLGRCQGRHQERRRVRGARADPQDKYLPMAAMQSAGSTIESSGGQRRRRPTCSRKPQCGGVSTVKVWDCTSACYSKRFLETAGAKAEGVRRHAVRAGRGGEVLPAVKAYVKSVGAASSTATASRLGRRPVLPRRGERS
jgi:hypothetical protein